MSGLRRNSNDRFLGTIHIEIKTSGFSSDIRQTIQRAAGGIEDDDSVIFDPRAMSLSGPLSKTVDLTNLDSYESELDRFASIVVPSFGETKCLVRSEKRAMASLTANLEKSTAESEEDIELGIMPGTRLKPDTRLEQNVGLEQEARLEGEHESIQLSGRKVSFRTAKPQPTANTKSKPKSQSKTKLSFWTTEPQPTEKKDRKSSIHQASDNEQETFLVEL